MVVSAAFTDKPMKQLANPRIADKIPFIMHF